MKQNVNEETYQKRGLGGISQNPGQNPTWEPADFPSKPMSFRKELNTCGLCLKRGWRAPGIPGQEFSITPPLRDYG